MAVATLSPARALRRTRRTDPRALIGLLLTVAALAGSVAFWTNASETRAVVVATRDVAAGSILTDADLGTSSVHLDDALYAAAIPADARSTYVGRQLAEPVHSQQVLARAQLETRAGLAVDQVAMTIPARPDAAVNGRVRPGDAVAVLVTVVDKTRGQAQAQTRTVLDRVTVLDVGRDGPTGAAGTVAGFGSTDADIRARGAIASLTLIVNRAEAQALAEARRVGELDVLLLPPDDSATGPRR